MPIRLAKGEASTESFRAINPRMKVPAMQEVDSTGQVLLNLSESHAIMRYLALSNKVADHWYPVSDLRRRAKVDEYLDLHHSALRTGMTPLVFKSMFAPIMEGRTYEDHELEESKQNLRNALTDMEDRLTKNRYLTGDSMSIADVSAAHELDQGKFIRLNISRWPRTEAWLHHMIDE